MRPLNVLLTLTLITLPALAWGPDWGHEGYHIAQTTPDHEDVAPILDSLLTECVAIEGAALASACEDAICDGLDDGMTDRFGGTWGSQPIGLLADSAVQWCSL